MKNFKRVALICLPLFLAACGTIPSHAPVEETTGGSTETKQAQPKKTEPTQSESKKTEPKKQEKAPEVDQVATVSPAVTSLLDRAAEQDKAGDQRAAAGSLERAIRIAPRYPESYYRLGEVRYKQGNYSQARSMGQKSISLGATGWLRNQSLKLIENATK